MQHGDLFFDGVDHHVVVVVADGAIKGTSTSDEPQLRIRSGSEDWSVGNSFLRSVRTNVTGMAHIVVHPHQMVEGN